MSISLNTNHPLYRDHIYAMLQLIPMDLRKHLIVFAGAALVLHGAKLSTNDIDIRCDNWSMLDRFANDMMKPQTLQFALDIPPYISITCDVDNVILARHGCHTSNEYIATDLLKLGIDYSPQNSIRVASIQACEQWYLSQCVAVGEHKHYEQLRLVQDFIRKGSVSQLNGIC